MEKATIKTNRDRPRINLNLILILSVMGILIIGGYFLLNNLQPDTIINYGRDGINKIVKGYDFENATWGNISTGDDAEIILNSPAVNYLNTTNKIQFNTTVNVTGGASLNNISLWHNGTGTWHRNRTEDFSGTNINEFITHSSSGAEGAGNQNGYKIQTNKAVRLTGVTKDAGANPTYAYLMDSGFSELASASFSGNNAIFSYDLTGETTYYIVTANPSSGWTRTYKGSGLGFPIEGTYINWTGGRSGVGDEADFAGVINYINLSLTSGLVSWTTTFNTTITEPTLWGIEACDSDGDCGFSTENRTVAYRLFQTGETFTTPTTSGGINPFILNLTVYENAITVAYLNYNNTNSLASIASNGNDYTITKNQIAPGVTATTNIPFYWNITQSDGFSYLTTSQNQSVSPIVINSTCTGMYNLFNFTMYDEVTKTKLNGISQNTSMKVDLNLYTSDRTTKLVDYYNEFSQTNPATICIDDSLSGGEQYSLDLQVQYSAINNSAEFYNVERYTLNSTTLYQNISLYDLDTTNTQSFRLRVRDTSYLPIDGALIQIERKYLENGTFFITEIPRADEGGISSASLQTNDVIYNFKIYDAGVLISTFNNVLAICQTPLVSTCEIDFNAFQSGITIPDYEEGDDFNFTLGYNDTSKIITSQFTIPTGTPSIVQLVVTSQDTLGTSVCSDTLTSASGTLSCTIPSSFGNSTVVAKLYKDSIEQGKGDIKTDQKSSDIFPGILIMLSVIVMITLVGMGVSDNPVVTAVFLFIGVAVLFGINLIQNTGFIGATATILFFAIAVILVIIKAARRN